MWNKLYNSIIYIGKTEGWLRTFVYHMNNLPNFLYPGNYNSVEDHNVFSLIFWWRQFFHFIGGLFLGFLFSWIYLLNYKVLLLLLSTAFIFICMFLKEFFLDSKEQPQGFDFKNLVDAIIWSFGYFITSFFVCYYVF